jgi:AcrR family transcriptional regulator
VTTPSDLEHGRLGRPRDQRLDAAILGATVALLEEQGYNRLTLAAVAERAGTTTTAIYRRWESKPELVISAVFAPDGDDVVADTGDIAADITTMVGWSVRKLGRPAAVAAVVGLLGEPGSVRAARSDDATLASGRLAERLERAQQDGEIRADVDTRVLGALIGGPVLELVLTGRAEQLDEAWVADLVKVVLEGARPRTAG